MVGYPSTDEYESHTRHGWWPSGATLVASPPSTYAATPPSDSTYARFDSTCNCSSSYTIYVQDLSEEEVKRLHAIEMRKRDLGYLYRPKITIRLHFLAKRPRIIFQPCWSSRRWRSVT